MSELAAFEGGPLDGKTGLVSDGGVLESVNNADGTSSTPGPVGADTTGWIRDYGYVRTDRLSPEGLPIYKVQP